MAIRKSQIDCVTRYTRTHYDKLTLLARKGERERIKKAADAAGVSASVYCLDAIRARLDADGIPPATDPGEDPTT